MTDLMPYAAAWVVLALVVIGMAFYRRNIASHEDDMVHLSGEAKVIAEQEVVAKKLDTIDKWGKVLTVLLVVSGIALASMYGLRVWEESSKVGLK